MTSPSETIAKAMEGVTAEEWIVNGDRFSVETNATYIPDQKVIALCATGEGAMARALYIAACSPDRMREVLDELYALRETALQLEAMKREMAEKDNLQKVVNAVLTWAEQRCPCHNEQPNQCPLCGASVENLEPCKSAENTIPRHLLADLRRARTLIQGEKP